MALRPIAAAEGDAMLDQPAPSLDPGDAYRLVRSRVTDLLRELPAGAADRIVPSCPRWTVRETLSHLVGACSDVLAGKANAAGEPEWTAAQVAARQGQPVADLLAEWATSSEQAVTLLTGRSGLVQLVMDAVSHEYDLRVALGVDPPADDPVLPVALGWLTSRFGRWLDATGRPALRLLAGEQEFTLGSGPPQATVRAGAPAALRTLTGRRSLDQVRALDWDGDPSPWLPALTWGPFRPTDVAVEPA
jgi:uncharacterized protein (TIGR03083 family)